MSKKKSHKKHQFKYAAPQSGSNAAQNITDGEQTKTAIAAPRKSNSNTALAGVDNFDYVAGDVKRVAVLAIGFVSLQVILWYLFGHTALGSSVYGLVKL